MGILSTIKSGIDAHRAWLKAREEQRLADLARRAEQSAKRRAIEEEKREQQRKIEQERRERQVLQRLTDLRATFADKSNQISIDVSAFFTLFKKPYRVKEPYMDRFAGEHQGVNASTTAATVGSIIGASATAYRRANVEVGMENFELARYIYDLKDVEVAMLKITNLLHAMGRIRDDGFNSVSSAILFNGGDCVMRPSRNPKTGETFQCTNAQEAACRACLLDNMPTAKAAFDPVFQIATREWREAMASGEAGELAQEFLGDPLAVIMN